MIWLLVLACGGDCPVVDADGDGAIAACAGADADESTDCDDNDRTARPGASEVCDGVDNNCDGAIDEGITQTYYLDEDGDGYGDLATAAESCAALSGYVRTGGDCDDNDPSRGPHVDEVCDGIDNDCDGSVDDGAGEQAWYADVDGDGTPGQDTVTQACTPPDGYEAAPDTGDCDDNDPAIGPDAEESCDMLDNDCDGDVDEGVPSTWYVDDDDDGFGGNTVTEGADCNPPDGYALNSADCDDQDPAVGETSPHPLDGNALINAAADMADICPCYTALSGTLRIKDLADSVDLAGLSCVESLGGLDITDSDSLTSLDGLDALVAVEGSVTIDNNDQLADIDGLASLGEVGGTMTVEGNPLLPDLAGLAGLTSVGVLNLAANDAMTSVGLGALEQAGKISISSCDALTEVTAMTALVELSALSVEGCGALTAIDLPALESISNNLYLYNNSSLAELSMPELAEVGGELRLHWIGDLVDLEGLSSVQEAGSLVLWGNADLANIDGLSSLTQVNGAFTISKNLDLATEDAEALRDTIGTDNIRGAITISDNGS